MATEDTQSTFDNVDWDSETSSTALISKTGIIEIFAFLGLLGSYLYDYYIIQNEYPTIGQWDVTSVEWMFLGVLILMVFNGILPLYRNQRMTKYYWRQFKKNKAAVVSLGFLIIIFTTGIIGPMVLGPPQLRFDAQYMPPVGFTASPQGETVTGTWAHPLGTNAAGEDLLKLIIFGMRVSMEVGLISMVIATTIGTLVGTTAAFATSQNWGMIDEALMRYVDLQSVFPVFILLLLLVYLFGGQLYMIILLYGFFGWEGIARLVRGEALQRSEEEFVKASRAAGANTGWIIRRHLVPNVSNTVITVASLSIPAYILGEAALSFLGFSDPTIYSWGQIIANGRGSLSSAPWISTIPGFFLFFTVLAFNFVGDAANDALDPRREKGGGAQGGGHQGGP